MATWRTLVKLNHGALGGTGTNTYHLRDLGSALTVVNGDDLLSHLEDFYTACSGLFPDGMEITYDGLLSGVGANEGNTLELTTWTVIGTGSPNCLPPANAVVVNWVGATGDRSKRGRTFLGPCAHGTVTSGGTPDPTLLGAMRAAAEDLVTASLADANGAFGVYSREGAGTIRDFATSTIRNQFAVLRSRRD